MTYITGCYKYYCMVVSLLFCANRELDHVLTVYTEFEQYHFHVGLSQYISFQQAAITA